MVLAVAVEPVKATPAMRTSSISFWPRSRPAGGEDQGVLGNAGGMGEADRISRDLGRLRGGLGDDAVARRQRRRDLAEEDGEREIPRRDADPDAPPSIRSTLRSPVGPGSSIGCRWARAWAA